ncbi:MAG: DUF1080 domain-containing protein [Bryobacterales bacterium]|nr:DUF1080 domain-containing protein [Bryobacterales bacterium]
MRMSLGFLLCAVAMAQEWEVLFDGREVGAWRTATGDRFPEASWEVKDGLLQTIPGPLFAQDLWTRGVYRDFEMEFEWRVEAKGNSGVKYLIQDWLQGRQVNGRPVVGKPGEKMALDGLTAADGAFEYTIGYEYQVIDEENLPAGLGPAQLTAAWYGFLAPARRAGTRPGVFHRSRIVVNGDHVQHWLDGELMLRFDIGSADWEAAMARVGRGSARVLRELPRRETPIALQHHSSRVAFRMVRVRRLSASAR